MRRGLVELKHHDGDEFGSIARVLVTLAAIGELTLRKIARACDHKGTLHIWWLVEPNEGDMSRVENAWCTQNESMLFYELPDGRSVDVQTNVTRRTQRRSGQ